MRKTAFFILIVLSLPVIASEGVEKTRKIKKSSLEIKVVPLGPTQAELNETIQKILQDSKVRREIEGVKHRLVITELVGNATVKTESSALRLRLVIYDYTNDECIIAEGDIKTGSNVSVRREVFDPGVGYEEISAAYELVSKSPDFADEISRNEIEFFEPMPPTTYIDGERLVNVGLRNLKTGLQEIVSVSFKNDRVIRYPEKAPPASKASPRSCGIPNSGQGSTTAGLAGQYQLTVTQNGSPLWEMLVIRPSASSGRPSERSGLEIRNVKYKGKSVLKRGHAPILTVKYVDNTCGPYRDWQYAEGYFQIPNSGVTFPNGQNGGIAILPPGTVATTAIETRNDTGNFQGVAIYRQDVGFGEEIVLVTEMNAGWYRYIMEWRFAPDGTIRPRYGFASTANSCVCNPRTHHVYWRFDFDIVQPNNKVYQVERGRKFMRQILTEAAILRDYQFNRSFLIQNANGDEAYIITPGMNDGSVTDEFGNLVDTFGGGDFWLLKFQGTPDNPGELDDPNPTAAANLAPWVNGESLNGEDIVIWYSAHQYRVDDTSVRNHRGEVISGVHVVGPTLKPVRW